jgi:hypothetical protein
MTTELRDSRNDSDIGLSRKRLNCGRSHRQRQRETFKRSCIEGEPTEGVRPNARENAQTEPPERYSDAWNGGSRPHLNTGLPSNPENR